MEFDYGFEYEFPGVVEGAAEGVLGILAGILLILWLLAMGFALTCYVLNAVGMYRIAKRRGIHHAWLAWIPVGCNWLLGSISDHYQYVVKHKTTKRRKILLTLSLILLVVLGMFSAGAAAMVLTANGSMAASILSAALLTCSSLAMMGLELAILVICYIAYYDLFKSCKPDNAVLYLILGVFFNVTLAFFVFFGCDKDLGMPARRAARPVVEEPVQWTEPEEEEIPTVETEVVEDPEE